MSLEDRLAMLTIERSKINIFDRPPVNWTPRREWSECHAESERLIAELERVTRRENAYALWELASDLDVPTVELKNSTMLAVTEYYIDAEGIVQYDNIDVHLLVTRAGKVWAVPCRRIDRIIQKYAEEIDAAIWEYEDPSGDTRKSITVMRDDELRPERPRTCFRPT